jgi:hypothetical protein
MVPSSSNPRREVNMSTKIETQVACAETAKRTYAAPKLSCFGDVRSLTQSGTGQNSESAGTPGMNDMACDILHNKNGNC